MSAAPRHPSQVLDQELTAWLVLCVVVGLLLGGEGCGGEAGPEPFVRWRCSASPMKGTGDFVVVCRDNLTLDCHAVWDGTNGAASLGVVPCDAQHAVGGGK